MIRISVATFCLFFTCSSTVNAADHEERTFAVVVDGKRVGTATMTFEKTNDGEQFSYAVEAKGRVFLTSFHYKHVSREVWSRGNLISIESKTNDDGKKTTLSGKASKTGLLITVNGKERSVRADLTSSAGWRLPSGLKNGDRIVTLDTEDGSETEVKVEDRGNDIVKLDGKDIAARKYKLVGKGIDDEWWFDMGGRPIQQHLKWDGQKVTLELTGIKR